LIDDRIRHESTMIMENAMKSGFRTDRNPDYGQILLTVIGTDAPGSPGGPGVRHANHPFEGFILMRRQVR
jgi:hypothetical protein